MSVTGAEAFAGTVGTNGILAATGRAGPLPIASVSTLIAALVVLEAKPLGQTETGPALTFSTSDHDVYGQYDVLSASVVAMKTGSTMSHRNAAQRNATRSRCGWWHPPVTMRMR